MWWGLFCTILGVGLIRSVVTMRSQPRLPSVKQIQGVVVYPSRDSDNYQRLVLREQESRYEFQIYTERNPRYQYGDELLISVESPTTKLFYPVVTRINRQQGNPVLAVVYAWRQRLIDRCKEVFKAPYAGIVLGIVFGVEDELSPAQRDTYRKAGITHILVASGFNVSILIGIVSRLLSTLRRNWRIWVLVASLGVYLIITGLEPPIIRAAIMGISAHFAMLLGRQRDSYLWLIYSSFVMICISPVIITSISFQLSFFATFAIITLQSKINQALVLLPRLVREDAATTIAVNIFTIPIIWLHFQEINLASIVVNLLILWTVPIIMLGGILLLTISLISNGLASVLAVGIELLLKYIDAICVSFAQ